MSPIFVVMCCNPWAWLFIAMALAGCSAPDNAELLKLRAAKQDAEWLLLDAKDRIDALQGQYSDLVHEFSDYQTTCKGAR
ncbi:hypothetical protein J7E62_27810 [Variovorax paradoxus]|nr:hypothetical protein [Variovorax paradoxus]